MPHALIVDDDEDFLLGVSALIGKEGFTTSTAPTLRNAREEVGKSVPDVVLLDMFLPDGSGIEFLKELQELPRTEVVMVTGHGSIDSAVEATRIGAAHYLTKPVDPDRIKAVLAGVAQTRELREEIGSLRSELRKLGRFGPLIGASPAMQRVYDLISRVARTDATVFLVGETGTGKELVAATIHEQSARRKEPFIPLNCGAVSPNLIESELFGHERGSFTGAERLHRGHFERAHKGSLFLDEVSEMPIELQVKLLRVLETGSLHRVGGQQPVAVDVRVIAATNRVPDEAIADGKLRHDLHYRLNVFPIHLPPLRERVDDVELLAEYFLADLNREHGTKKEFTRAAIQRLRGHPWPGNVRELKNLVHRAFILAEDTIGLDALSLGVEPVADSSLNVKVGASLDEVERRVILATLEQCDGDQRKAAAILKISLKTLYNRLNAYGAKERRCPDSRAPAREAPPRAGDQSDQSESSCGGRSAFAGPLTTRPCASKRDPWQGQSHVFSNEFQLTMHPRWGHVAERTVRTPRASR
jgi:DNA-binding NtrC family response regulator